MKINGYILIGFKLALFVVLFGLSTIKAQAVTCQQLFESKTLEAKTKPTSEIVPTYMSQDFWKYWDQFPLPNQKGLDIPRQMNVAVEIDYSTLLEIFEKYGNYDIYQEALGDFNYFLLWAFDLRQFISGIDLGPYMRPHVSVTHQYDEFGAKYWLRDLLPDFAGRVIRGKFDPRTSKVPEDKEAFKEWPKAILKAWEKLVQFDPTHKLKNLTLTVEEEPESNRYQTYKITLSLNPYLDESLSPGHIVWSLLGDSKKHILAELDPQIVKFAFITRSHQVGWPTTAEIGRLIEALATIYHNLTLVLPISSLKPPKFPPKYEYVLFKREDYEKFILDYSNLEKFFLNFAKGSLLFRQKSSNVTKQLPEKPGYVTVSSEPYPKSTFQFQFPYIGTHFVARYLDSNARYGQETNPAYIESVIKSLHITHLSLVKLAIKLAAKPYDWKVKIPDVSNIIDHSDSYFYTFDEISRERTLVSAHLVAQLLKQSSDNRHSQLGHQLEEILSKAKSKPDYYPHPSVLLEALRYIQDHEIIKILLDEKFYL